jgi:hypothetical protein
MNILEEIRSGIVISNNVITYRALFLDGNFHVYRLVSKGRDYRGNVYPCDGYTIAWSDILNGEPCLPPQFVPLRANEG